MSKYVSPMVRARAIVAGLIPASKGEMDHARRMVNLPAMIIIELEREEAPVHAFRWIAWGGSKAEQRRRTDLLTYLRRSIARPRNGWLKERHFAAALAEWDRSRSEARKRGGVMPNFDQIPVETYGAAIQNVRKQPRPSSPEMVPEGNELLVDEEEENENEDGSEADAETDDESPEEVEEEPISTRGRGQVLRHLSEAVRAALAADDMEAADAANDAISRLCGGRKRNE